MGNMQEGIVFGSICYGNHVTLNQYSTFFSIKFYSIQDSLDQCPMPINADQNSGIGKRPMSRCFLYANYINSLYTWLICINTWLVNYHISNVYIGVYEYSLGN